jgi:hypothetical protein
LKTDRPLSDDDKEYIDDSKILFPAGNRKLLYNINYLWKEYDEIKFYRNYDSVTFNLGGRANYMYGKRKLNKEIYVSGLPEHFFDKK